jgi:hypothetical protein
MDQYADDLAELIEKLDLNNLVMIGHSTGGGEVAHYIGRHGSKRVAKVVLVGAVPPLMLKTATNPEGTPLEVFDGIRKGTAANRSQFFKDLTMPFYGFNRPGAKVNDGLRASFWLMGMQGGIKGEYDCVHEFSEVDYTADLKKIDKPTLVIHGDDDQIVPIAASGEKTAKIVKGAQLKVYKGAAMASPRSIPTPSTPTSSPSCARKSPGAGPAAPPRQCSASHHQPQPQLTASHDGSDRPVVAPNGGDGASADSGTQNLRFGVVPDAMQREVVHRRSGT